MGRLIQEWTIIGAMALLTAVGCIKDRDDTAKQGGKSASKDKPLNLEPGMEKMLNRFVPTIVGVKAKEINKKHRAVLKELLAAARIIDRLYFLQVSKDNPRVRHQLFQDKGRRQTLDYFDIMYGPWDRLDQNKPFYGDKPKPKGAAFYPEDLDAEELEKWVADHPRQKAAMLGYFTVIEREGEKLKASPYSEAYRTYLEPIAEKLEKAAALAADERLAKYLRSRAKAFLSNEYRESDMDWMDLGDGDLEVVIGPYEVYEDELMGLKAAFEAFIALRHPEDSAHLERIKAFIPDMEAYLPIPDEYKNPNRAAASPISVVDLLFAAGDARAGVQTLAFNLPNDEVVREKKGSKKVMLKNVARAKFQKILIPIAERLMVAEQFRHVTFEAFFNHTLVHETAHGLGPGKIAVEGKNGKPQKTTVNEQLKELYAVIEEAKADVLGMYLNYMLIERGFHAPAFEEEMYASFLAGLFRSVRFGAAEAHGQANVIQFNYLLAHNALKRERTGECRYVAGRMRKALESLAREILMIQAEGDYEGAVKFIETYGKMPGYLERVGKRLESIPVDIKPIYPVEELVGI